MPREGNRTAVNHMTQDERLEYLIKYLLSERSEYDGTVIPESTGERRGLLRSLMNVRAPSAIGVDFLTVQDEYLQERLTERGVQRVEDLQPAEPGIYLWQGDITTLAADGIVNAANSGMTGCYVPCHGCIDNAIHTYAGVQLRLECARIMAAQGHEEPTGAAKITPGYNLPAKYVLHTVGPIVRGNPTLRDCELLARCYRSCLELAAERKLGSVAFCCIATGEFGFPNCPAADIAVKAVRDFKARTGSEMKVIFNVFKDKDYEIYSDLLG